MSKYHTLTTKITIIFGIAFSVVCLLFLLLNRVQLQNNIELMQKNQIQSINYLIYLVQNKTPPMDLDEFFKYFSLKRVENKNIIQEILKKGEQKFAKQTSIALFKSIFYKDRYYLYLANSNISMLLEAQEGKNSSDSLWIAFFMAMILLSSIYMSILKSISPLKSLSQSIRKFAAGNMDIEIYKGKQKDEISEVAIEFDKAVKKIKHLIKSRQLFLRTIMHELKTPIGKGRIISEMLNDDVQKHRLINIFERLNLLINEFSKIEQLVSKSYILNKAKFPISSVVEQARDLLMLDEKQEKEKIIIDPNNTDEQILVDFDLMSLAIKNLMDNALKYASDKKVKLQWCDNYLRISNKGEMLKQSIDYYLEPFVGTSKQSTGGLGLGLYIVKNILDLHNFELVYSYSEETHRFDIIYKKERKNAKKSR